METSSIDHRPSKANQHSNIGHFEAELAGSTFADARILYVCRTPGQE
jgi:hypothetical protein